MNHQKRWILCIPALLALGLLTLYPLGRTFYYSFTDAQLSNMDNPSWVGSSNYSFLFQDPAWWSSMRNTLTFTFSSVLCEIFIGMGLALLLNSKLKARGLLRTAILIPWAIPAVVSARIWAWMFNDIYGVINEIIRLVGFSQTEISWLADERLTLITLILVDVWKTTPFVTLLILTALQSIPSSIHEAAQVDGASAWKKFRSVTLPLIRPALGVAVLFRTLDALRVFDLPFILTSSSKSTAVLSIYARQQMIDYQDIGYGSAASFLIFCLIGIVSLIYLYTAREQLGLKS